MIGNLKILVLSLLVVPGFSPLQQAMAQVLKIRHTKDFAITGDGSASNWNLVDWMPLPQRTGNHVIYQTKMKILYSDSGIYCLYACGDKKISATLKKDFSDLYNEDVVEAFFWPDDSIPIYFEYELSPLGYELPLLVPNIWGNYLGWLPWHYEEARKTRHAAIIHRKGEEVTGWTAEFFIPFALLTPMNHVPPRKGTRWRSNFYRIDEDNGTATWQWRKVRNEKFHDDEKFGTIEFN